MLKKLLRKTIHSDLRLFISHNRKKRLVQRVAGYCSMLHCWYENLDGNFYTNGEYFVLNALKEQDVRTIFDVGANVGEWAQMAHQIFPSATIHAFEVVPRTYETLSDNVKHLPQIITNSFGLSDIDGEVAIKYYPDHPELAALTDFPHQGEHVTLRGVVREGDSYVEENEVERINFLKLDVEGTEHLVLKGMSDTLTAGKIDIVQFEYGRVNILTKFLLKDFYDFFVRRGYVVGKIYPNYVDFREYCLEHEDFIGQNYLAVPSSRFELIGLLSQN